MRSLLIAVVGWLALGGVGRAALVAHYELNDNAASTAVVATVGSNATLGGGDNTSVLYAADGPGTAITSSLHFNGSDDFLTIPTQTFTGTYSISVFVKHDGTPPAFAFFVTHNTENPRLGFNSASTTQMLLRGINGGASASPNHGVTITAWHHYLLVRDSSNIYKFYVDGAAVSTNVFSGAVSGTVNWNRASGNGTSNYVDGYMARLKFFDSDESANAAALYAERDSGGGSTVRRQAVVVGSLNRPYHPTDIDWRCSPFAAFFGALAP